MDIAKTFERAPDSTAVKSGNLDIPELRPTHTGSALQFFVCFCLPNDEVALFGFSNLILFIKVVSYISQQKRDQSITKSIN